MSILLTIYAVMQYVLMIGINSAVTKNPWKRSTKTTVNMLRTNSILEVFLPYFNYDGSNFHDIG